MRQCFTQTFSFNLAGNPMNSEAPKGYKVCSGKCVCSDVESSKDKASLSVRQARDSDVARFPPSLTSRHPRCSSRLLFLACPQVEEDRRPHGTYVDFTTARRKGQERGAEDTEQRAGGWQGRGRGVRLPPGCCKDRAFAPSAPRAGASGRRTSLCH